MLIEKYLKEDVVDITKQLRGAATDSFITKVIDRATNDLGWALSNYEEGGLTPNNRKALKKDIAGVVKQLNYLQSKLK